jgi:hypothetical protein
MTVPAARAQYAGVLVRRSTPRALAATAVIAAASGCSTTPLDLGSNDAGIVYDAACAPGSYEGTYVCTLAGNPFLALLSSDGMLGLTLVPSGATSLSLTADAAVVTNVMGTLSTTRISGTLDCSTGKLTGTVGDVTFQSSAFSGTLKGGGSFTANYVIEGGAPTLVDGVLEPPASLAAQCTWTAQHK